MADYQREHTLLLPVIQEAGAAVMRFFQRRDYHIAHKDPENPVTEADFAANRILVQALRTLFPRDAILSEETEEIGERNRMDAERSSRPRVWVIDPIDGTREFIKGRPQFAISLGLVVEGAAVLGFVFNPAEDCLLSGGPGIGLWQNGKPTFPKERPPFAPPQSYPRIVVSRTELNEKRLSALERVYPQLEQCAMGSIAWKLALVACGQYDLAVSVKPKNEWDIAGAAALLAASGLELREGDFSPVRFNKPNTESLGLIAGTAAACRWYHEFSTGQSPGVATHTPEQP